jgi:hypothetical protein
MDRGATGKAAFCRVPYVLKLSDYRQWGHSVFTVWHFLIIILLTLICKVYLPTDRWLVTEIKGPLDQNVLAWQSRSDSERMYRKHILGIDVHWQSFLLVVLALVPRIRLSIPECPFTYHARITRNTIRRSKNSTCSLNSLMFA